MTVTPLRAVTIDLWQTLIVDNRELGRARAGVRIQAAVQALTDAGLAHTEEQVRDAYRQCYRTCHAIRQQELDVSFSEQVGIFLDSLESGLANRLDPGVVGRISEAYADGSFFAFPPPLAEGVKEMLQQLRRAGYPLALISNTGMTPGATFRRFLQQMGILGYFSVLTFSDEVRLTKPSAKIFGATLEQLDVAPEQTAHVGDHLLNDVAGAKRAGLWAVWLEGFDEGEPIEAPDVTISSLYQVEAAVASLAG